MITLKDICVIINTMASKRVINGVEVEFLPSNEVRKMSDLELFTPYQYIRHVKSFKNKYGTSNIVEIKSLDDGSEFNMFMPEYLVDRAFPGRIFQYEGLKQKPTNPNHKYQSVSWAKK